MMTLGKELKIALTPQAKALIEKRLQTGLYRSAEEVVYEGLRLIENQQNDRGALAARIARSHDQALAGRLLDGEEVFDRLEARLRRRIGTNRKSA